MKQWKSLEKRYVCMIAQCECYGITVWPEIFQGANFRGFDPRKLNPRNKKPKHTCTRAITGGVAIVVHAAAQLD